MQGRIFARLSLAAAMSSAVISTAMAQDVIGGFLTRVDNSAVTWANIIVVLGIVLLGGKYVLIDHRDSEKLMGTVWGCLFLLGARAIATFFLPVAAP